MHAEVTEQSRQVADRQGVLGGQDRPGTMLGIRPEAAAHGVQTRQPVAHRGLVGPRVGSEGEARRMAVDQLHPQPLLQLADAPREGRLGDVAHLGGLGEGACLDQSEKIFNPLDFHNNLPGGGGEAGKTVVYAKK